MNFITTLQEESIWRLYTAYVYFIILFTGLACFFIVQQQIDPLKYAVERKITRYGGLFYMIGGTIFYILARILS